MLGSLNLPGIWHKHPWPAGWQDPGAPQRGFGSAGPQTAARGQWPDRSSV